MMVIRIRFDDNGLTERLRAGLNLRGPMQRAVNRIVARAKANAPVRTGRLRRSIAGRVEDNGRRGVIRPSAPYWPYVEFGTRYMQPRYYIRRAVDADHADIRTDIERTAVTQIEGGV